jgi:hypothetical protein
MTRNKDQIQRYKTYISNEEKNKQNDSPTDTDPKSLNPSALPLLRFLEQQLNRPSLPSVIINIFKNINKITNP